MNYHIQYGGDTFSVHEGHCLQFMPPLSITPSPPRFPYGGDGECYSNLRCQICTNVAEIFCPRCKGVGYCSQLHLIEDETSHRRNCNPLKNLTEIVRSSETHEVKCVLATLKIQAGDTVSKLQPLMMAPHDKNLPGPANSSLCLGCCRWFPTEFYKCEACGWPVCSSNCANNSLHTAYECQVFRSGSRVPPQEFPGLYDTILVLRLVMLLDVGSHRDSVKTPFHDWKIFCSSPENVSKRHLSVPEDLTLTIQDFILKTCGYKPRDESSNCAEYLRRVTDFAICNSICQENPATVCDCRVDCIRVRNYHSGKYFFPYLYAFSRSCSPNTNWTINHSTSLRESTLHLWAAVSLQPRDIITVSFDETFSELGTLERRSHLRLNSKRDCDCSRCSDPKELKSMASAIRCTSCNSGFILPKDSLDAQSVWICDTEDCQVELDANFVVQKFKRLSEEIKACFNSIRQLQRMIKKLRTDLHPKHYLIVRAADRITQLGWLCIKNQTLEALATYNFRPCAKSAKLCLDFATLVSPGFTKERARYLFMLQLLHGISGTHNAIYHFRNNELVEGRLIRKKFERIYMYQLEFCKILQYEKIGSPLHNKLMILEKSKDDLGELLRTSSRRRGFDCNEIERLKRAYSYFTLKVYTPAVPRELQVDVSHVIVYQATPFRPEYKTFFEFQENREQISC